MRHAIYNNNGEILRIISCPSKYANLQVRPGEKAKEAPEGISDVTHKVVNDEFVKKTPAELEAQKPPTIPEGEQPAYITKEQWQTVLKRITALEVSEDEQ